jgi:hypothetical protein
LSLLFTTALPCLAQVPQDHSGDDQAAQLLRQLNDGGADAAAARRSLNAFLRSGDMSVYHLLASPDHDLAKLALAFIGNKKPAYRTGYESPFVGAGPFLAEMCATAPNQQTKVNAFNLLGYDEQNITCICDFLADDKTDNWLRYQSLAFESRRRTDARRTAERDALEKALPAILPLWDKRLWDPLPNPQAEQQQQEVKHSMIAALVGSMHVTPAVMKIAPQLAVKPELAVALIRSFSIRTPQEVPNSVLFQVVGSAAQAPGGAGAAADELSRDLWLRHAPTDFYAGIASDDPLVRKGAAYGLAAVKDSKYHTPARLDALVTQATSPELKTDSLFCRMVARAVCESTPDAIEGFVITALTGSEPTRTNAANILAIAGQGDQPLETSPVQSTRRARDRDDPGAPDPNAEPGSYKWLQSAALVRSQWETPGNRQYQRAANLLQRLGWRAGPITRIELRSLAKQGNGYGGPGSDLTPEILPPPQQPTTWFPMPPLAVVGPLAKMDANSAAFSIATLVLVVVVILIAGFYWAVQPVEGDVSMMPRL